MKQPSLLSIQGPRSRQRVAGQRGVSSVSVHIHEIVLHGFERANRDQVDNAFRQALMVSLQRTNVLPVQEDADLQRIAYTHDLRSITQSADIGRQLAKSVMRSLQQLTRTSRGIRSGKPERVVSK